MDINRLKARCHNLALDARNLSRIVDSEGFARAWGAATEEQRVEINAYILSIDKSKVDSWVKKVLANIFLDDKSFRELRDLAKAAGIPYYNNKSKEELLEELKS